MRRLSAESRKGSGSAPMWTGKSWRLGAGVHRLGGAVRRLRHRPDGAQRYRSGAAGVGSLRPGFCPTRGDSRLTVVPEGDIGGGLAVYILKLLSGRRANFIEPFYIIHQRNRFAAGHAGPNDYTNVPETWWWPGMSGSRKPNTVMRGRPLPGMFFPRGRKPCCICRKKTVFLKWYARWWRLRLPSITWRAIPIPSSATKPCPRRNCFSGLSRSA